MLLTFHFFSLIKEGLILFYTTILSAKGAGKQPKQTNLQNGVKKNRFKDAGLVASALPPKMISTLDKCKVVGRQIKIYLLRSLSSDLVPRIPRTRPRRVRSRAPPPSDTCDCLAPGKT